MQIVPLQPIASQSFSCTLNNQAVQINLYQVGMDATAPLYLDLLSGGATIATCRACKGYGGYPEMTADGLETTLPFLLLREQGYLGFQGDFLFIDTQASPTQPAQDPQYTGLGSRWQLLYLSPTDLAAAGVS